MVSEATPPIEPTPPGDTAEPAAPIEAADPPPATPRASGRKRRFVARWARRLLAVVVAVVASIFVAVFSIDLGRFPQLKSRAEKEARNYLERTTHIGRIQALITPGSFAVDDLVIEGRKPGDRPFFKAKRVYLQVMWWSLIRNRELVVRLRIDDWEMVVENWSDGHNIPKLMPKNPSTGPKRFTTTVQLASAHAGQFTYDDHTMPWTVIARNLTFDLTRASNLGQYVGRAGFKNGTVQIQQFQPMRTDMETRFVLNGSLVDLTHLDLRTDGTASHVSGRLNFARWPESTYNIVSELDFSKMRAIFFANQRWQLSGTGQFNGVFSMFKGGHNLAGEFSSETAAVDAIRLSDMHGALVWTRDRFAVTHLEADTLGGETNLTYTLAPFGKPGGATASFDADYTGIDAASLVDLFNLDTLALAGRADGSIRMRWPNGRFGEMRGTGHTTLEAPEGIELAATTLPPEPLAPIPEPQPFDGTRSTGPLALGADVHYSFDPGGLIFEQSWAATSRTYIAFSGYRSYSGNSRFPFHVTSHDWQESDRLLASIMTTVTKRPTTAVEVGGRGTFDGEMNGLFSAPVVTGKFAGESMRVWGVTWGQGTADLVIHGGYVTIANSRISGQADSLIVADGRYSLGFRTDNAEEIDAKVAMTRWPLADLRTAFQLDDWPVTGSVSLTDLVLTGRYKRMFGTGQMRIENGTAWDEPFESATGDLTLEGTGVLVSRMEMKKDVGLIHGAARVGWSDSTYAFTADGDRIPVESLSNFKFEKAPLTGLLRFKATGAGSFDAPEYTVDATATDLFVSDEGIGQVTARMIVRNETLTFERFNASSSRLQVNGTGTIAINDASDADLRLRFQETSIDPYLRFFAPAYSPYTRLIATGSLQVRGPLSDPKRLFVDATVDAGALTLFDYQLTNDGPIRLGFDKNTFSIGQLNLKGQDTKLQVTGGANLTTELLDLDASGDASLAILQLFFPSINASGAATLAANLRGSTADMASLRLTGEANLANGRLRHLSVPHSIEQIGGRIVLDSSGVRLDDLRAAIGGGAVTFGGAIAMEGFRLGEFNLTAAGKMMRLSYPTGFTSTVNADLTLTGRSPAPVLSGSVEVLRTSYAGSLDPDVGLFGLAAGGTLGGATPAAGAFAPPEPSPFPLALNIDIHVPSMSIIRSGNNTRIDGSADLLISGTIDRPALTGRVDIEGGEVTFNGNRYFVRRGTIDFVSPARIEPVFDIEVDTRPRASGQTFNVTIRMTGTLDKLTPTLSSDPWLPDTDILSLLLGAAPDVGAAEQRARLAPQESQQRMFQQLGVQLLASPLTTRVGSVFEETLPIDTVQITPVLFNESSFTQLNPTARITLGKRISSRVYLTYARTLSTPQDEIILLEFDQNDRISWVLSRNEDRTFALDFRVRYVF